jgi:hypothetical protein
MKKCLMASLGTLLLAAWPLAEATTAIAYNHSGVSPMVSDPGAMNVKITAGEQPWVATYDALAADCTFAIHPFV